MSWPIRLAVRSREDDLADVACAASEIEDPEERAVARTIAIDAAVHGGMRSAGELLDHLEQMTQGERRKLHNRARVQNDLPTVDDVLARREFERANDAARRREAQRPISSCAICGRTPTGPGGMPKEVPPVRRWHCLEHEHLAADGDMQAPPPPLNANFAFHDPDEAERGRREDAAAAEAHRLRLEERQHEAAERAEVQRAREAQVARELF